MSLNGTRGLNSYNILSFLFFKLTILLLSGAHLCHGCYPRMFIFGDSLTDTGNFLSIFGDVPMLPYGQTFFHKATGRWSDGRVFADFIAKELGMSLPVAYLNGKTAEDFLYGANFAVGGATAMNHSFFQEKGITVADPRVGFLALQIQWFKQLLTLLCPQSDCRNILESSLFLVGEIGVNDYNIPASSFSVPFDEIRTFVPHVIQAIGEGIKELIELGAKTLVVPGIIPFGCTPYYLTMFRTENNEDYDEVTGCMKWLNEFSYHHEKLLKEELNKLQRLCPEATIIHADYNGASIDIFKSAERYGFTNPLFACCGGEGRYNFTFEIPCGDERSRVCADPSRYLSWDGFHLTDRANELIVHRAFSKIIKRLDVCESSPDLKLIADSMDFEL
ncbi:sinapine esterase-like [Carex rostrata]